MGDNRFKKGRSTRGGGRTDSKIRRSSDMFLEFLKTFIHAVNRLNVLFYIYPIKPQNDQTLVKNLGRGN